MKEKQEVLLGEAGHCSAGRGRSEPPGLCPLPWLPLPLRTSSVPDPLPTSEPSFQAVIGNRAFNFHLLLPN